MKYLIYLLSTYCLIGCGNKKEIIVEEIKKAKNERIEAEMKHDSYSFAAKRLLTYNMALQAINLNKNNLQLRMDAETYKKAYENAIQELKDAPKEILNDQKKLDSSALFWKMKAGDAQRKIDSLELELKKY